MRDLKMGKISLILMMFGIVLFSLISLSLVAGCDEAEMQTAEMQAMMTGNAVSISNGSLSFGYLSLIKYCGVQMSPFKKLFLVNPIY